MRKERDLTTIAKNLRSSSHSEIELELFEGEAGPNPTLLEKHSSCWNGQF